MVAAALALAIFASGVATSTMAASYTDRPKTACDAAIVGPPIDPSRVFTLPVAPDTPDAAKRCDLAQLALAVADEGHFPPIYEKDTALRSPTSQIQAVIDHIKGLG